MAKKSKGGFVAKMLKAQQDFRVHCPVCNEAISYVKHIVTETNPKNNSVCFKEKMVGICKCNKNDIFK